MLPVVVKALFVDSSSSIISTSPNLVVVGSSLDPSSLVVPKARSRGLKAEFH